jgi:hypothetical protein
MKVLITNPDAILDKYTGHYYPGLLKVLKEFDSIEDQGVMVISNDKMKLSTIEEDLTCMHVDGKARGGRVLIDLIKETYKLPISDIFILGCKSEDIYLAANNKLLLLRAQYSEKYFKTDRIHLHEYGIKINDAEHLTLILDRFININKPWFYKLQVSEKTVHYSLTNANTMGFRSTDIVTLADEFKKLLKDGKGSYKDEFMIYFLISSYSIFKEFETVNYWGVYPSSGVEENTDLGYFSTKVRQTFNGRPCEPILIRHTKGVKRHKLTTAKREENGCDGEFDTIRINPHYSKDNKLKGKTVCIIDDFTNIGSSCETARHLLEQAGIAKLIFITMGKFGKTYVKYNYELTGDLYGTYYYKRKDSNYVNGILNSSSDIEFVKSLGGLIK